MAGLGAGTMASKKDLKLIHTIIKKKSMTSKEVEEIYAVSNKTARKMIALLNEEIRTHGARFESKPGKGYTLIVEEQEKLEAFIKENQQADLTSVENRPEVLIRKFTETEDYLKIETLAEQLYMSPQIISKALKKAENYLNSFGLHIERRPHYGMKLTGREYDIRRCLATLANDKEFSSADQRMEEAVRAIFRKNDVKMSEVALRSFLETLQVALGRIEKGIYVEFDQTKLSLSTQQLLNDNLQIAEECITALEEIYRIELPEDETYYTALNIADKKYYERNINLLIDEEVNTVVTEILESIYETYQLDFRKDLEFYMMLVKHLIPLKVRLQYGTMIKNPILQEVKSEYPFALSIAKGLNHIIEKYYGKELSEDELSYIALAIQLAMDKKKKEKNNKKNILLVCASGNVFSRFFKYRFKELFKDCINEAYTCDYPDLKEYDFGDIDYVFSTVPVDLSIPVPAFQVDYYPDEAEMDNIRTVLEKPENVIERYFSEELFLPEVEVSSKEDVIRQLCERIQNVRNIPDEFYDLVMKREKLLQTAMGDLVAVPHPYRTVTDHTLISVAILKKPIYWNETDKVQVVFMVSVSQNDLEDIENFYAEFFKVALSKKNIERLISNPTYDELIQIIRNS